VQAHNLLQHVSSRLVHVLQLDAATLLEPAENRLRPQRYLHAIPTSTSSDFGLNARPDVQEANERVRAAKDYASSAMWELFSPELRAELGHVEIGRSSDDLGGRDQWGALLLWTLSVDEVGQLRKRKAEEQAARLRSLRVSDLARHEIRNAARDLDAAAERIPLAGSGLEAAQSNLRLSEARFKAGAAIMLEVLDAQNVLADAHLNLARAIVAYNSSQARLLAATGAITRASFGAAGGYATDPASR
jgi:outer membrane protein TolC